MKCKKLNFKIYVIFFGSILLVFFLIPIPAYSPSKSKILYDRRGEVLSATISTEQQWCFELDEELPENFIKCLLLYEDEYFYYHPGVNPVSIIKAAYQNVKEGRIVRGGSTITMQLMRMKNRNSRRTFFNKLVEACSSVKYSILRSKRRVLSEWAEMAPFGGNTIGIKAASMRYFNKPLDNLSWAEYALLAVMPNSPAHANLSKNRDILQRNRDFLLKKLSSRGYIPESDLPLYLSEELPKLTHQIPVRAFHLLDYLSKKYPDKNIYKSTVDGFLQDRVSNIIETEKIQLQIDGIENAAAVVIDIERDELLAYIGNIKDDKGKFKYVDIVQAQRSYGSLLKPILYAYALETGRFLPKELIPDLPLSIAEFRPLNFDKKFRGAVGLDEMVIQSLNVPSVWLLHQLGLPGFYQLLQNLEIKGLDKGVNYYGLSLILGGGETSLWEMTRLYKGLAQNYRMKDKPFAEVVVLKDVPAIKNVEFSFSATPILHTVEAMSDVVRPREEKYWQLMSGGSKIAWKTGTSYGHRDAWAIGFNGKYLVGVWVGNENGEGRYNLTGIVKAAPMMFRIFNSLPNNKWFEQKPFLGRNIQEIKICAESGKLAGAMCTKTYQAKFQRLSHDLQICKYHKRIHVSDKGFYIDAGCPSKVSHLKSFFLLPPAMDYYYRQHHLQYKGLPPPDKDCPPKEQVAKIVYPETSMKLFIPRNSPEFSNQVVGVAHHTNEKSVLYWFVDNEFVTETHSFGGHQFIFSLPVGRHRIAVIDENGNTDEVSIEVIK